jgi:hypothetical protein
MPKGSVWPNDPSAKTALSKKVKQIWRTGCCINSVLTGSSRITVKWIDVGLSESGFGSVVVNEEEDRDFSEDVGIQSNTIKSNKIIKKP